MTDAWFRQMERNMSEGMSYERASEQAFDDVREVAADRADRLRDEAKHEPPVEDADE